MRSSPEYRLRSSNQTLSTLIFFSCVLTNVLSGRCPPQEVVFPCVCDFQTIRCEGNQPIDLKSVFTNISKSLATDEKGFQFFEFFNTAVNRLEDNTFFDISFRFITIIDAQSLETIEDNFFNGTSKTIEVFSMIGEHRLKSMSQLFHVLESLDNVVTMTLDITGLQTLPSFAFYRLNRLQELSLSNQELNRLSDNCLNFEEESDKSLIIDFSNNNLTEFSFDKLSLSHVKRPLEVDLRDNELTILEAKIFRPFLLGHIWNSINVQANPINCSDCRNRWLVEDKHIFEDKVFEARCSHFVSIFELDLNYYKHCT